MANHVPLGPGSIVWVNVPDTLGNPTHGHAAVVLTSRAEIEAGGPIALAVISSQLHLAKPEDLVAVPWRPCPGGHEYTHLDKKCAAVCTWLRVIKQEEILEYDGGFVPSYALTTILKKVAALKKQSPPTA